MAKMFKGKKIAVQELIETVIWRKIAVFSCVWFSSANLRWGVCVWNFLFGFVLVIPSCDKENVTMLTEQPAEGVVVCAPPPPRASSFPPV